MAYSRCAFALVLLGLFCTACSHLDLSTTPLGDQSIVGTVDFHPVAPFGKMSVLVRLVDVTNSDSVVLGEQSITSAPKPPVAFSITYSADAIVPPKHVQLEARVAIDGKLRYYNLDAYPVSTMNANGPVNIWVEPVKH